VAQDGASGHITDQVSCLLKIAWGIPHLGHQSRFSALHFELQDPDFR